MTLGHRPYLGEAPLLLGHGLNTVVGSGMPPFHVAEKGLVAGSPPTGGQIKKMAVAAVATNTGVCPAISHGCAWTDWPARTTCWSSIIT